METRSYHPFLIAALLLAATSLTLAVIGEVPPATRAGIRAELPGMVGDWRGREILYCRNEQCAAAFVVAGDQRPDACGVCGAGLSGMSVGETALLPAGARVLKKLYTRPSGLSLTASIVLMGTDRTAIHDPMICLRAQGYRVAGNRVAAVPLPGRAPLRVTLLDLRWAPQSTAGEAPEARMVYAYWFVAENRETPSRLRMMAYVGLDRLFRGRADRWAYVSILLPLPEGSGANEDTVSRFVASLYPLLALHD